MTKELSVGDFFTKYTFEEEYGDDGFLEKYPKNLRLVQAFYDSLPNCIWSLYDSGEIICGYHFIDVIGYYITQQEGVAGETYVDYDLKKLFDNEGEI